MRLIDADKLMECYENTPDCNIDDCSVPAPVIRQNILDMPTVNPYEWINVEDRLPEKDGMYLIFSPYTNKEGGIVYCNRFLTKGNPIFPPNSFESISKVTHWMPLPIPPTEKEN